MTQDNLNLIWNKAVSVCGGMTNTQSNFNKVAQEFLHIAKAEGFDKDICFTYVEEFEASISDYLIYVVLK